MGEAQGRRRLIVAERPERPPIWPLLAALVVIVLVVIGALSVVGWVFRTVTSVVVVGLLLVAGCYFLRRR